MNREQLNIDGMFEQARSSEPMVSFEETEKAFLKSTLLAAGGVLATKGVLKLLSTKKWLIMFSAITTISTASIIGVAAYSGDIKPTETTQNDNFITAEVIIPVPKEENNLSTKTIVFTEDFDKETAEVEKIPCTKVAILEPLVISENPIPLYGIQFPMLDDSIFVSTSDKKIRAYSERFEINNETTMADLEAMKEAAEKAGIKLNYTAKIKNNKLMKISIHAEINQQNNSQNMSITSDDIAKDKDEIIFGWFTDDSGKADEMGFGEPMNSNRCCNDNKSGCKDGKNGHKDEGSFFGPRMYDFLDGADTLNEDLVDHFEDIIEEMEEELAYLEDDLLVRLEDVNLTRIDDILERIEAENGNLLEELEQELNALFQEIQLEIRDEKESRHEEKEEKEKMKELELKEK